MTRTITVKELKEFLKDWPEEDEYGDPYEVWLGVGKNLSSPATELIQLNRGDIYLGIDYEDENSNHTPQP